MIPSQRLEKIRALLEQKNTISVQDLCQQLYCSPSTIRRDLLALEHAGVVERTRGGARLLPGEAAESAASVRHAQQPEEKNTIATLCAPYLQDNMSLFLDSSTTVHALCPYLTRLAGLVVITNSIALAGALHPYGTLDIFLTGGKCKPSSGSLLGETTIDYLRNFQAKLAIISCSSLGAQGFFEADHHQSMVKRTMMAQADQTILLCDHSKIHRTAYYKTGELHQIDLIITDQMPPHSILHAVTTHGCNIIWPDGAN